MARRKRGSKKVKEKIPNESVIPLEEALDDLNQDFKSKNEADESCAFSSPGTSVVIDKTKTATVLSENDTVICTSSSRRSSRQVKKKTTNTSCGFGSDIFSCNKKSIEGINAIEQLNNIQLAEFCKDKPQIETDDSDSADAERQYDDDALETAKETKQNILAESIKHNKDRSKKIEVIEICKERVTDAGKSEVASPISKKVNEGNSKVDLDEEIKYKNCKSIDRKETTIKVDESCFKFIELNKEPNESFESDKQKSEKTEIDLDAEDEMSTQEKFVEHTLKSKKIVPLKTGDETKKNCKGFQSTEKKQSGTQILIKDESYIESDINFMTEDQLERSKNIEVHCPEDKEVILDEGKNAEESCIQSMEEEGAIPEKSLEGSTDSKNVSLGVGDDQSEGGLEGAHSVGGEQHKDNEVKTQCIKMNIKAEGISVKGSGINLLEEELSEGKEIVATNCSECKEKIIQVESKITEESHICSVKEEQYKHDEVQAQSLNSDIQVKDGDINKSDVYSLQVNQSGDSGNISVGCFEKVTNFKDQNKNEKCLENDSCVEVEQSHYDSEEQLLEVKTCETLDCKTAVKEHESVQEVEQTETRQHKDENSKIKHYDQVSKHVQSQSKKLCKEAEKKLIEPLEDQNASFHEIKVDSQDSLNSPVHERLRKKSVEQNESPQILRKSVPEGVTSPLLGLEDGTLLYEEFESECKRLIEESRLVSNIPDERSQAEEGLKLLESHSTMDYFVIDSDDDVDTSSISDSLCSKKQLDEHNKETKCQNIQSDNSVAESQGIIKLAAKSVGGTDEKRNLKDIEKLPEEEGSALPGQSFIICCEDPSSATVLTSKKNHFFCALCHFSNVKRRRTITEHVNLKEHILNVMELECPEQYEVYKGKENVCLSTLKKIVFECQKKEKKQLIFTTPEMFVSKREIIRRQLIAMKQNNFLKRGRSKGLSEAEQKRIEEKPKTKRNSKQQLEEEERFKLENLSFEISCKQRSRTYKHIVLLFDMMREYPICPPLGYPGKVRVQTINGIDFTNALQFIKEDKWFGKGTLYIFLCGLFTIVHRRPHTTCKQFGCPYPSQIYFVKKGIHANFLIMKALTLHRNILDASDQDMALFCDLIPVHVDKYNIFSLNRRQCLAFHPIDFHRRSPAQIRDEYLDAITSYNQFMEIHTNNLGFQFWNLVKRTFRIADDNLKLVYKLLGKGDVHLNLENCKFREEVITENVRLLASSVNCHKEDKIENKLRSTMITPEKTKAGKTESSTAGARNRYDRVVILAHKSYEALLKKHFAGDQVTVFVCEEKRRQLHFIKSLIKFHHKQMPEKTLWIALLDLSTFIYCRNSFVCRDKEKCSTPLIAMIPSASSQDELKFRAVLSGVCKTLWDFKKEVKAVIAKSSDVLCFPSSPVAIYIDEDIAEHKALHAFFGKPVDTMLAVTYGSCVSRLRETVSEFNKYIMLTCSEILKDVIPSLALIQDYIKSSADCHVQFMEKIELPDDKYFNNWKSSLEKLLHYILNEKEKETKISPKEVMISSPKTPTLDELSDDPTNSRSSHSAAAIHPEFNHVVFIGSLPLLNLFSKMGGASVSHWPVNLPVKKAEIWKKLSQSFNDMRKILFLLLADVSVMFSEKEDSLCNKNKCSNLVRFLTTDSTHASEKVQLFTDFSDKLQKCLSDGSKLVFAPLCPRFVVKFESDAETREKSHSSMHTASNHTSCPCFFYGKELDFFKCIPELRDCWDSKVESSVAGCSATLRDLVLNYQKKKLPLVEWRTMEEGSLNKVSMLEIQAKALFRSLIDSVSSFDKKEKSNFKVAAKSIEVHNQTEQSHYYSPPVYYGPDGKAQPPSWQVQMDPFQPPLPMMPYQIPPLFGPYQASSSMEPYQAPQMGPYQAPPPEGPYPMEMGFNQQPHYPWMNPPQEPYSNYGFGMNQPFQGPFSTYGQNSNWSGYPQNEYGYQNNQTLPYSDTNVNSFGPNTPAAYYSNNPSFASSHTDTSSYNSFSVTPTQRANNQVDTTSYVPVAVPVQEQLVQTSSKSAAPSFISSSDTQKMSEHQSEKLLSAISLPQSSHIKSRSEKENNIAAQSLMDSLSQLQRDLASSIKPYSHVIIVGKEFLVNPLKDLFLKNTSIVYLDLSTATESEVSLVLSRVKSLHTKNSVCLLAFGFSVFTKVITIAPTCFKFKCLTPISVHNLSAITEHCDTLPNSSIIRRMKEVEAFVTKLCAFLPSLALPLYPSKVFCDDGSSLNHHRTSHAITAEEAYVVQGTVKDCETYFGFASYLWNDFLKSNHKNFAPTELVGKYIAAQMQTPEIRQHIKYFFTKSMQDSVWKHFVLTLAQTLSGISGSGPGDILKRGLGKINIHLKDKNIEFKRAKAKLLSATSQNAPSVVKIWNWTDSIPDKMLTDFVEAVDSEAVVNKTKNTFVVKLPKIRAELIVSKLHNIHLGDSVIKACIIGEEDKVITLSSTQKQYVERLFDKCFSAWKPTLLSNIAKNYASEPILSEYKTKPCQGSCKVSHHVCPFYHNEYDRRRLLKKLLYTGQMCPLPKVALGKCISADNCYFSHNVFEQMFHPRNVYTVVCPNVDTNACSRQPYCPYAHRNTPEILLHPSWVDLVVPRTSKTFEFFVGALRALKKVSAAGAVKVCLISPSTSVLLLVDHIMNECFKELSNKAVYVTNEFINPDNFQVFYGTPAAVAKCRGLLLPTGARGILIVDGIAEVMELSCRSDFLLFWNKLKFAHGSLARIKKVFVSSHYKQDIGTEVSRFLGIEVMEVPEAESSTSRCAEGPVVFAVGSGTSESSSTTQAPFLKEKSSTLRESSPSVEMDIEIDSRSSSGSPVQTKMEASVRRRSRSSSSRRSLSRSRSRSRRRSRSRSRRLSRSRTRRRPHKPRSRSRRRSRSHRNRSPESRRKRTRSKSREKRSRSKLRHSPRKLQSPTPAKRPVIMDYLESMQRSEKSAQNLAIESVEHIPATKSQARSIGPSSSDSSSLTEMFGDYSKAFLEDEKELQTLHNEEYEVLQSFPELHPEYETLYQEFAKDFDGRYGAVEGETRKEKAFRDFWTRKFRKLKFDHWQRKRVELVSEYKKKAATSKSVQKSCPVAPQPSSSSASFSVGGTLTILEKLADKVGVVGPALLAIVKSARDLGINTPQGLGVFLDPENEVIINLVVKKLCSLLTSSQDSFIPTIKQALDGIDNLLGCARNPPKHPNLENLNLDAIASASLGKDSGFIVNMIRTAIAYEGLSEVSNEEMNKIFLQICSIHFIMQMEK